MSRCMCGDTACASCGTAQGTFNTPLAVANRHIRQLCSTVNTLAGFRKVRIEDFIVQEEEES